MTAPTVFISYSHDSPEHKAWVLRLATELRGRYVDTIFDQWDLALGEDTVAFMEGSIARADRVLLVCTEEYVQKANGGAGGVGYEKLVITGELVARIETKKFIPLVRHNGSPNKLPHYLGSRLYLDFTDDAAFDTQIESLVRELHGSPASAKPPLGPNPFAGTVPAVARTSRDVGVSGFTSSGVPVLDDNWFASLDERASMAIRQLGRSGSMEIRAALHDPVAKSQIDLLNAVRKAEIRTFGWPIAVVLDGREDARPRPTSDGIVAEVAIAQGKSFSGESSYDLWAARNNGDFFLKHTLFEDERRKEEVFFDTRIVRVTEALLFLAGFYETLGVGAESRLSIRITHDGLAGRTLTNASMNRHVWPRQAIADRSDGQLTASIRDLRERTTENVMLVLEPLFLLFDFASFDRPVYESLVENFKVGRIG